MSKILNKVFEVKKKKLSRIIQARENVLFPGAAYNKKNFRVRLRPILSTNSVHKKVCVNDTVEALQ